MARTQAVTILFCDLVASTERRARLGDDAFDEFSARLFVALREAVAHARGREVSNAGDGMMIVFPDSVADAVSCAIEMHREVSLLDAADPPRLRIGISCGEVAQDRDQYSGMPIVEAARLEAAAAPGQTLANGVVRALVGTRRALRFRDVGALTLKGIPQPLATVEVLAEDVVDLSTTAPPVPPPPARGSGKRRVTPVAVTIAVVVAIIAGVIVVNGRSGSKGTPSGVSTPGADTPKYAVAYAAKACPTSETESVPGLTCGTLTVPEDRSKPSGRVVKLDVYRAPARGSANGDPVLDFGAENLATSPARDHSEEIQLGQRGWGGQPGSSPSLTCPEYAKIAADALSRPYNDVVGLRRDAGAIRACYDRWTRAGIDLNQYNYLTTGDDMVDLIRALHFSHVNLVSGYVATISALEVIRKVPDLVRTLTLQEPVAPGNSAFTDPTKYLSDAFNNYVAVCRADRACNATFPNLPSQFRHDYEVYRSAPRVAHGDDGNGHTHDVLLDAGRAAQALRDALSHSDTYPLIAADIGAANRSGVIDEAIAGRVVHGDASLLEPDAPWGAQFSSQCSYELHTIDVTGSALSRQTLPQFSGVDTGSLPRVCKAWPVREIGQVAYNDPSTTVPTLIVAPNLLPAADPQWSEIFRRGLPNATVLTFSTLDGAILSTNDPPCLATLRREFLADPTAPLAAGPCERQSPPIHFLASLGG